MSNYNSTTRRELQRALNHWVSGKRFVDRDTQEYLYASLTQPPLKVVDKNDSDDELDWSVECPNCGATVNFGTEIALIHGRYYCFSRGCKERVMELYENQTTA